jgi:hypothetical protein
MNMNATNVTAINNGDLPKVTLKLLTGTQQEGGRGAGVFTADDLINILLYVRESRQLPQSLSIFIKELGTNKTGIVELEPDDIFTLFQKVTDHANRWTPVENKVKEQSSNLTVASKEIVSIGNSIIEVINKMDIVDQFKTLDDSSITIPITSDKDKQIQAALPQVISKLKASCEAQQSKTNAVREAVRDYRTEISGGSLSNGKKVNGLEPVVADKKDRAKKADLNGTIVALQTEIDVLDKQIEQKKKDYQRFVGLAFTGAAGGPIGLAITGGIFGAKAEAVRKERNRLIVEKFEKSIELKKDQMVQGALNVFATQFTDLGMRLLDAEEALNNLDFLWTDIISRIDQSVDKWASIKDSDMLLSFVTDLKLIVDPWKEVGDMTMALSKVFESAYDEFRKTYES